MPIPIELDTPYDKQQEIIDDWHQNKLLVISRRWGKTTLVSRVIKHSALTIANFRAAYSAPTFKLMMEVFETYRTDLAAVTARLSWSDKRIELINGSVIEFWSSDDKQAGRGRKYHIWVHDEAQRQSGLMDFIINSVRPTLVDFGGSLWVLGTANGEGSEFHEFFLDCVSKPDRWLVATGSIEDNPYLDKAEIQNLRVDMGPVRAAQELDSEWVKMDGITPLIRKALWDGLYTQKENTTRRRVLALDASVSGDTTALVGVWSLDEHFYTDYGDIACFEPDPYTGEIDYTKLEEAVWQKWVTGRYSVVAYDPYQLVYMNQRLRVRGVQTFEFTQNSMRLKADSFFKQVLGEGRYHHPDHPQLTEHVMNATLKYSNDSAVRIVKLSKKKKIDLAVATSMAVWALNSTAPQGMAEYVPVSGGSKVQAVPVVGAETPFGFLKKHDPFKRRHG